MAPDVSTPFASTSRFDLERRSLLIISADRKQKRGAKSQGDGARVVTRERVETEFFSIFDVNNQSEPSFFSKSMRVICPVDGTCWGPLGDQTFAAMDRDCRPGIRKTGIGPGLVLDVPGAGRRFPELSAAIRASSSTTESAPTTVPLLLPPQAGLRQRRGRPCGGPRKSVASLALKDVCERGDNKRKSAGSSARERAMRKSGGDDSTRDF